MHNATPFYLSWQGAGGKGGGDLQVPYSSDSFVIHILINNLIILTPIMVLKGLLGTAILDHTKNRGPSHLRLLKHLAIPDFLKRG